MDEEYWRGHPHWCELSTRAFTVVSNATGVHYDTSPLDALCRFSSREMLTWPGAGKKTVREIEDFVASHGRQLHPPSLPSPAKPDRMAMAQAERAEREAFERAAFKEIEVKHPDIEWLVMLLDHGRKVGVRAMYFGRGRQIIGPREDVIAIADALAEEVGGTK